MIEDASEQELRSRQDGRVYPFGAALRSVFDADNHATLGSELTGLMIDLSKLPYGDEDGRMPMRAGPAEPPAANRRPSVLARLAALLGHR